MLPEDRRRFPPVSVVLKNGRRVTLRLLECGHGEVLATFFESVPREDFRFYCPYALTREEAFRQAARADAANYVCVLGMDRGKVAGYAWYDWPESGASISSFGICIHRGWQGVGTGEAVMRRALEIAREIGPPRMCLTVQLANSRAVALYRKMGFEVVREQVCGERWGFPAEPEYYMERPTR